ncbi:MAG: hypothetical protein ACLR2G_02495 [Phascolarctobacterium faecium]
MGREALRELVRAIGRQDLSAALQLLNRLAEQGKDVRQILTELASICGRCCSIKHRPDTTKFI